MAPSRASVVATRPQPINRASNYEAASYAPPRGVPVRGVGGTRVPEVGDLGEIERLKMDNMRAQAQILELNRQLTQARHGDRQMNELDTAYESHKARRQEPVGVAYASEESRIAIDSLRGKVSGLTEQNVQLLHELHLAHQERRGPLSAKELGPPPLLVPLEYRAKSRSSPHPARHRLPAERMPTGQTRSQLLALQPERLDELRQRSAALAREVMLEQDRYATLLRVDGAKPLDAWRVRQSALEHDLIYENTGFRPRLEQVRSWVPASS